jgi:ketosteroid isomerase-like protein
MKSRFTKVITILFLVLLTSYSSNAQNSDKEQILAQIETLFDGMRAGDSSAVSKVFTDNATMQSIFKNREGETVINAGSLTSFKNAIGTPHNEVWDERVANIQINVDGEMATAWVPYSFYLGDNFSHCGVNSFQFAKTAEGWKAISIVDTRRRTNCAEDL